ncbi:MAG: hypothetical protein WCH31_05840 [Actinomycetes bacterium]
MSRLRNWLGRRPPGCTRSFGRVLSIYLGLMVALLLAVVERRTAEPILPFDLLRNPIVAVSVACMALIGIGAMTQVFMITGQNTVRRSQIGSATALTQFSRQMGATVGVAVMGVIVNTGLPAETTLGDRRSVDQGGTASPFGRGADRRHVTARVGPTLSS